MKKLVQVTCGWKLFVVQFMLVFCVHFKVKVLMMNVIIVGAGASGMMAAINIKKSNKNIDVKILEHQDKLVENCLPQEMEDVT